MDLSLALIILIGICLIYLGYEATQKKCPPPRIEYRFIPRTLQEEMENPVNPGEIFYEMFNKSTPFVERAYGRALKNDTINGQFISQI